MKTLGFLLLACFLVSFVSAQDVDDCLEIELETVDQIKESHGCILALSNYFLIKPLGQFGAKGREARKIILSWMEKTPDYQFSLNANILKICSDDNILLFGVYTTCLAKAALEGGADWEKNALEYFVKYVQKEENGVKQNKRTKKLMKDWYKGNYEKYIGA